MSSQLIINDNKTDEREFRRLPQRDTSATLLYKASHKLCRDFLQSFVHRKRN